MFAYKQDGSSPETRLKVEQPSNRVDLFTTPNNYKYQNKIESAKTGENIKKKQAEMQELGLYQQK